MKYKDIFKKKGEYFVVENTIRCGGATIEVDMGDSFKFPKNGFILGGVNFSLFEGRDLEVEIEKNCIVITGIY